MVDDGSNFAESVVSRRTSRYKGVVVDKVAVSADVSETIPCDPVSNGGVVKSRILSSVVLNTGKFVYPHKDTKSHVCL